MFLANYTPELLVKSKKIIRFLAEIVKNLEI